MKPDRSQVPGRGETLLKRAIGLFQGHASAGFVKRNGFAAQFTGINRTRSSRPGRRSMIGSAFARSDSGSVNEMRALVVRTRIRCVSALTAEQVGAWAGVGSVTRDGPRLEITAPNAEAVVRQLLGADEDLQELEVRRAGLAEVFTELTQEDAI